MIPKNYGRHSTTPWDLLVEEVTIRFKLVVIKHLIEEFKRLHQNSTIEEYIINLGRMKTRLLYYDPYLSEKNFIEGFLSGLKERMRHLVEILHPTRLNEAFNFDYKIELSIKSQQYKGLHKPQRN
jgi:hypothetical protein